MQEMRRKACVQTLETGNLIAIKFKNLQMDQMIINIIHIAVSKHTDMILIRVLATLLPGMISLKAFDNPDINKYPKSCRNLSCIQSWDTCSCFCKKKKKQPYPESSGSSP